jgi:two-component system response regulator FixJ
MTAEPTVFVVDDDKTFLESIAALLQTMGFRPATYDSSEAFLRSFDPEQPGCLILDIRLPNISGLALQERLSQFPLRPPIIVLTAFAEISTALRAMRQGAVDFLEKPSTQNELLAAVRRALELDGEQRTRHREREALRARLALLSTPERQVLNLVLEGCPNKKIATTLGVSRRAVEDRRARVMQKLEVSNLPELVRLAISAGVEIGQ